MSPERLDRPAPKVALVTGGAGFVGSHLIRRIVEQFPETSVISIDNYFTGSVDNHVDDPRVQYITASSLDINRVWDRRRLPSPDVTFHLGEYSRIVQSFGDFDDVWEFNIRGTKEVVAFCHERGSLLVYAGFQLQVRERGG